MDDAKEATQHKATKISKSVKKIDPKEQHKENVRLIQANHMRTVANVRDRQNNVLFKDSGC